MADDKGFLATLARGMSPLATKGGDSTFRPIGSNGIWPGWLQTSNWSGKPVTVDTTLQLSTANACIRLISETLSTLPVFLLRRSDDGAPVRAYDHPLYALLHSLPNARMSAAVFWQVLLSSLLLWGNAYVEKKTLGRRITSLVPLPPDRVTWKWTDNGGIVWTYNDPATGMPREIAEDRMWHIPAFTLDGINGISPVRYGANVFGSAIAADQASADTFRNALKSPGLLMMDSTLTGAQREELRAHVRRVSDSGGVMVMEKGAGFQALSMNPQDAELLASRAFGIEEICRWFRVPPFMVGHAEKSTSWGTGIEQQMIGFVTFVLRPWAVRIEQGIRKDLLSEEERAEYSAEFALEGLLRGDSAARAAFYSAMVNNGCMTRDEVRRLENLPPAGGNAAVLTVQSAMLPIDQLGQGRQPPPQTT